MHAYIYIYKSRQFKVHTLKEPQSNRNILVMLNVKTKYGPNIALAGTTLVQTIPKQNSISKRKQLHQSSKIAINENSPEKI